MSEKERWEMVTFLSAARWPHGHGSSAGKGEKRGEATKQNQKKKTRIHARRRAVVGQVVYSFSEESYFHPFSHTFLPMSERVKGGIERGWGFCCSFFFTRATAGTRHRSTRSTFSHPLCHLGRLCSVGTGRFSVELFFFSSTP